MKTFKDFLIMQNYMEIDHYTLDLLQQAAREWVDRIEKDDMFDKEIEPFYGLDNEAKVLSNWIKHFFNLDSGSSSKMHNETLYPLK